MTGSLIIVIIVIVTDTYFYFCNKKQARGALIIEPVEGSGSSVSLKNMHRVAGRILLTYRTGQVQVHLLSTELVRNEL
jgi:hypothetical protein